jgi:hypothetical protein
MEIPASLKNKMKPGTVICNPGNFPAQLTVAAGHSYLKYEIFKHPACK